MSNFRRQKSNWDIFFSNKNLDLIMKWNEYFDKKVLCIKNLDILYNFVKKIAIKYAIN